MDNNQFGDIISKLAASYAIDPRWMKAIISQESKWNQWAVRYEINYMYTFEPQKFVKGLISLSTEVATQKMSWGLCQIMGGLAREQGHLGLMPELLQPEVNLMHLAKRIITLKKLSTNVQDVFAAYNGGPGAIHKNGNGYVNQNYVTSCLGYLQNLST